MTSPKPPKATAVTRKPKSDPKKPTTPAARTSLDMHKILNRVAFGDDPSPAEKKRIEEAMDRWKERPPSPTVTFSEGVMGAPHGDNAGHTIAFMDMLGTGSVEFAMVNAGYLETGSRSRGSEPGTDPQLLNAALAIVQAVAPQNEIEGALAVQMAGSHALSAELLGRAKTAERVDHVQMFANLAVKLQRVFVSQTEALARLRGKGQQTVRVEHVTVHTGGQAIVGDVHHHPGGTGASRKTGDQPHDKPTAHASQPALQSPDPQGNGMPIPGHAERAVPDPRRTVARRAARKSERAKARLVER